MSFASITALLQAALVLLSFAQGNPNLPQSLRDTAIQTAQQAISEATTLIAGGAGPTLPAATGTGTSGYFVLGVASNATVGTYLTDHSGMTVYFYDGDTNGSSPYSSSPKSNCYGDCAKLSPPYLVGPGDSVHQAMSGVDSSKIGTMIRTDGSGTQLTYSGMPLYFYSLDTKPGDTKGDRPDGVWHVVNPGRGDSSVTSASTVSDANIFSASPFSGSAPLSVIFSSKYGGPTGVPTGYEVDFGDGSTPGFFNCDQFSIVGVNDVCATPAHLKHTYLANGVFMAKLISITGTNGDQKKEISRLTITVSSLSASITQGSLAVDFGIATDYANSTDAVDFGDGTPLMGLNGWCSANNCSFHHAYAKSGTYTVKVVPSGNGCGEVGICSATGPALASAVITLSGNSTGTSGISATIDQNGQTLSISANPNITGAVPAGYDTAQVWIVPSGYTGATDHATLFWLTRGYVVNPGISFSGSTPSANGRFAMPLSFVLGEAPLTTGAFTLLLFGVPHGDSIGPYHDSDFTTPPTLLFTAHVTLTQ